MTRKKKSILPKPKPRTGPPKKRSLPAPIVLQIRRTAHNLGLIAKKRRQTNTWQFYDANGLSLTNGKFSLTPEKAVQWLRYFRRPENLGNKR